MTKKHLIKVYREAAQIVAEAGDDNQLSCNAIHYVLHTRKLWSDLREIKLYRHVMDFEDYEYPLDDIVFGDLECVRVFMLLFMAEWVRTDYKVHSNKE
jgi:hypothetical protein